MRLRFTRKPGMSETRRVKRRVTAVPQSYWTERIPPAAPVHAGNQSAFLIAVVIILAALFLFGGH